MANSTTLQKTWNSQINAEIEFLIFRNYYSASRGTDITSINKMYLSPFTDEKTPSFHIFKTKDKLMFKCFSTGEGGDVIKFVMLLTGDTYFTVLKTLVNSYMLTFDPQVINIKWKPLQVEPKYCVDIIPVRCDYDHKHRGFLDMYSILMETVEAYSGFPISSYQMIEYGDVGGITISSVKTVKTPFSFAFTYMNKGVHYPKCKIYSPGQTPKMFGNTGKEDIFQKIHTNSPILNRTLIAAGQKDTMILSQCVSENTTVIAANSENVILTIPDAYVLLDNDQAGLEASAKYEFAGNCISITQHFWKLVCEDLNYHNYPGSVKDIGELHEIMFSKDAQNLIIRTLNQLRWK